VRLGNTARLNHIIKFLISSSVSVDHIDGAADLVRARSSNALHTVRNHFILCCATVDE
jgi:hypothetical protein